MANGADINAVTAVNFTIFCQACYGASLSFVQELAGKVPPDHLSMPDYDGVSPMQWAFQRNPDYLPIVRMLILRGATVRPQDFPAWHVIDRARRRHHVCRRHLARRRPCHASHCVRHAFLLLFLFVRLCACQTLAC